MKIKEIFNIPNIITMTRFFLVPLFIWLFIQEKYLQSLTVLSIAGFTDACDGFIARKFHMRTRLGSLLDPTADKFLMILSYVFLTYYGDIPLWLTYVVIGRDLLIAVFVIWLNVLKIKLYYRPTRLSKVNTVVQIAVLISYFILFYFNKAKPDWILAKIELLNLSATLLAAVSLSLTLASSVQYGIIAWRFYKYGERKTKKRQ